MLLRLGDLLDVDNGRFNMVAEEMIGGLPATSEAHKEKYEATTHLLITPEKIEFSSNCPNEFFLIWKHAVFVTWLKDEIHFLTNNWVRIVPKGFQGFAPRFDESKLCINGVPDLEGLAGLRFEIKQKKAFEIIEVLVFMKISWFSSENCYKMLWMLPKIQLLAGSLCRNLSGVDW